MISSSRKTSVRRQKVRQLRAESSGPLWGRMAQQIGLWPALVTTAFFIGTTVIALYGEESLQYTIGQKIDQPIIARVDFVREDVAQTRKDKEAARANTPSYYRVDHEFIDRICAELTNLYQEARAAETVEQFKEVAAKNQWPGDEAVYHQLHALTTDQDIQQYRSWVAVLRDSLTREYTIRQPSPSDRAPPARTSHIMVIDDRASRDEASAAEPFKVDGANVVRITEAKAIRGRAGVLAKAFPYRMHPIWDTVEKLLTRLLQRTPILVYDQARTLDAMNEAERGVKPVLVTYEKGEPFVFPREAEPGEQPGLTAQDLSLLQLERKAFREFMATNDPAAVRLREMRYLGQAGSASVFAMVSIALFGYVGFYRPRILQVRTRTLAFGSLLLGTLLAVRVMDMQPTLSHLVPVPVVLATSIVALAYDRRFAVGAMAIAVLMVVMTVRGDIGLFATLIGGVIVVAFMLEDVRSRTQIISAGIASGAVMFAISFAFALVARQEPAFGAVRAAWAALSALLAALVFQAVLPYIERGFKIATWLTLSEWRDANKPLLQLLVQKAPGTYNHSLVLGTMAHTACAGIGANGLLAQVGALYHDIGKIHQSEYFAENQEASINRHDRLEPRMSLLVILSHVKNGIALANEYGLPRILHQFIAEHHGTTVVRYFHHSASEKQQKIASGRHDREVLESEFRYEGPKPRSRETAILMLCDGVEGAVRALHEPTAGRIESVVHSVLMDRLQDGQFDDCDITLKELYRVEESLVKSLCRFYHGRVAYPKTGPQSPQAPSEADEEELPPESSAAFG